MRGARVPPGEFALIDRFFRACGAARADVRLGVGDDAALLACPPGEELVAALDTLVAGVHFPPDSPAASIGHRALAVNLSDLAAMGARPAWALLGLTLPAVDEGWLDDFAHGLGALARAHEVALVGGDTTSGPLCISVQVLGFAPAGTALRRAGGRPGDLLFVSGSPGDAAAGLQLEQGRLPDEGSPSAPLRERFLYPTPRIALGLALRGIASACIDVSDGLLGDAGKLATASGCGVEIAWERLPVSPALVRAVGDETARGLALTGGDDYELCFAVPPARVPALDAAVAAAGCAITCIGALSANDDSRVTRAGSVMQFAHVGYDHFARG